MSEEQNNVRAVVFKAEDNEQLAMIMLNGYNIAAGGPLGKTGAMRSFKILRGDLWDEWNIRSDLVLKVEDGREATARVAAHPAEDDSFGLIEFL